MRKLKIYNEMTVNNVCNVAVLVCMLGWRWDELL